MFKRCGIVLKPGKNWWDKKAVFNPAATTFQDKIILLFRAVGDYNFYISRLGLAVSKDGINFERKNKPVLWPQYSYEKWGIEDPRISKIGEEYFITYVALHRRGGPPIKLIKKLSKRDVWVKKETLRKRSKPKTCLALTTDFKKFTKKGRITPKNVNDKDVVFFPKLINKQYVLLHRPHDWKTKTGKPSIWLACSKDLKKWTHRILFEPRYWWEAKKIGAGPPPIETEKGWLFLYHGVGQDDIYRTGIALIDIDKKIRKIRIKRYVEPIFEPKKSYEKKGDVPDVAFPTGIVQKEERGEKWLYVYYGAADKYCCLAKVKLNNLLDLF